MDKGFNSTSMEVPPSYQVPEQPRFSRRFIIVCASLLVLLVGVVVAGVLLGVFIGGKNATELYQLTVRDKDGNVEEQVVQVNPKENIATFYIQNANSSSSTVLLDYDKNVMVMRANGPSECFVREIGTGDYPSLSELRDSLKNLDGQTVQNQDDPEASSFVVGPEIFDRSLFGRSSDLLCKDVKSFWLLKGNPSTRKFCGTWKIRWLCFFKRCLKITLCLSWSR